MDEPDILKENTTHWSYKIVREQTLNVEVLVDWSSSDSMFVATAPEYPGVSALAPTISGAIHKLEPALTAVVLSREDERMAANERILRLTRLFCKALQEHRRIVLALKELGRCFYDRLDAEGNGDKIRWHTPCWKDLDKRRDFERGLEDAYCPACLDYTKKRKPLVSAKRSASSRMVNYRSRLLKEVDGYEEGCC